MRYFEVEKVTPFFRHDTHRVAAENSDEAAVLTEANKAGRPIATQTSPWVIPQSRIENIVELEPGQMTPSTVDPEKIASGKKPTDPAISADFVVANILSRLTGWRDMYSLMAANASEKSATSTQESLSKVDACIHVIEKGLDARSQLLLLESCVKSLSPLVAHFQAQHSAMESVAIDMLIDLKKSLAQA